MSIMINSRENSLLNKFLNKLYYIQSKWALSNHLHQRPLTCLPAEDDFLRNYVTIVISPPAQSQAYAVPGKNSKDPYHTVES